MKSAMRMSALKRHWHCRLQSRQCPKSALAMPALRSVLDHQEDYQMWHRRADYIIPSDEETVGIGRGEYMAWY
ncbi:hypothetical protein Taro_011533 [Colocasia esculenta]|uniref:Uncharacterized protein n=1 Tax=Colocasia esculenta TaxID=4460 RepID=A0A843UB61_COLES|nr:hypothetical protein [Colocasia esculenta]